MLREILKNIEKVLKEKWPKEIVSPVLFIVKIFFLLWASYMVPLMGDKSVLITGIIIITTVFDWNSVFSFTRLKKSFSFLQILPQEKREEILGDLYEIKEALIENGSSKFKIWRVLSWMKITIYLYRKKDQLSVWLEKQFKIIK